MSKKYSKLKNVPYSKKSQIKKCPKLKKKRPKFKECPKFLSIVSQLASSQSVSGKIPFVILECDKSWSTCCLAVTEHHTSITDLRV